MVNLKISPIRERILASLIISSGFFLRLFWIAKKNLWFDELLTNNFSLQVISLKAQWKGLSEASFFAYKIISDPVSILYSLLVFLYSIFFGNWESLRYLSLIFSTLSLIAFYKLARLFLDQRESICALLILALSPFQIWYAQEAREYSLSCLLSIVLFYLYIKALRANRLFFWACFSLAGIASLYTSYYFIFPLIISGLILFFKENRKYIRKWCLSVSFVFIAVLPLFPIYMKQLHLINSGFWLRAPPMKFLPLTFGVLSLGYTSGSGQLIIGTILFIGLFIYGAYAQYRVRKKDAGILLLFFPFPIFIIYIISKTLLPIYLDRKFIIFAPIYYLFLSKGIIGLKKGFFRFSVSLCAIFLVFSSLFNYYRSGFMTGYPDGTDIYEGVHFKKDYYGLMDMVIKGLDNDTALCVTDVQSFIISIQYLIRREVASAPHIYYFMFYPKMLEPHQIALLQIDKNSLASLPPAGDRVYCAQREYGSGEWVIDEAGRIDKFDKIWLISSTWNKRGWFLKNSSAVRRYFLGKYDKLTSENKDGILIELYAKRKQASETR